jgi:uncharacterized lipoprotein YbaY
MGETSRIIDKEARKFQGEVWRQANGSFPPKADGHCSLADVQGPADGPSLSRGLRQQDAQSLPKREKRFARFA